MTFHNQQRLAQIEWRKKNITSPKYGFQNGKDYPHIVPRHLWEETLWQGIRTELPTYLKEKEIQSHTGTHNLLSSWVVCANLYFIIKKDDDFRSLMLGFLQRNVSRNITRISDVELEFALPGAASPENLLGEKGGTRGSGQTSPDVAFIVETETGNGLILTECKYTEHSFYPCSARRTTDSENKVANPDPTRCVNQPAGVTYKNICHQSVWGRKYWNHLTLSDHGRVVLKCCPACTAGYQLLRQQSLAEGIAAKSDFADVYSAVAFDERNKPLITCLRTTGIPDFTKDWEQIFTGKTIFKTWTHQQWVEYVRQNAKTDLQRHWVDYLHARYGY